MKLIIQIPCFNEEETLPATVADLPREIPGVDSIELLVIDDGSTDATAEVARRLGVHGIVRLTKNRGLAAAFSAGLDAALKAGADIIVNTDADNQYYGPDVAALVAPIVRGEADIVIGDRQTHTIPHFSWTKKRLQKLGSWVVRRLSGAQIADAASGFRAYSREAGLRLSVVSDFSYTLETIIQAVNEGLKVVSVPVRTNPVLRKSRLFRSIPSYLRRQVETLVRVYAMYQPLRVFLWLGGVFAVMGLAVEIRFLYYFVAGRGAGHVQSVIVGGVLLVIGFFCMLGGIIADLIAANRKLLQDALRRLRRLEAEGSENPGRR
jgi:glycosyltransferase involved in cell wall biosynthesis